MVQPLWKTVWRLLRKLKIELSYDPAIPLLGIYPDKTMTQKEIRTAMFIIAQFTIAKPRKQPERSSARGMDEKVVAYAYNGILLSHKKEQNNAIYNNMDATRDCHTK